VDLKHLVGELWGDGIFTSDGAVWKFHRKVASHLFTHRLLRESTFVATKHTTRMINHLKSKCHNNNSNSNEKSYVLDMQDMYFRLTMDVFSVIAFGEDFESTTRDEQHEFAVAFDSVSSSSSISIIMFD
jgi:cytochrome P450